MAYGLEIYKADGKTQVASYTRFTQIIGMYTYVASDSDWGDGVAQTSSPLNETKVHTYTIAGVRSTDAVLLIENGGNDFPCALEGIGTNNVTIRTIRFAVLGTITFLVLRKV